MANDSDSSSITVSLSTAQKDYVTRQATASGCTPSEYICRLIHADQRAREQEHLERTILEGLDSPARQMTAGAWKTLRATLEAQLGKPEKGR